jgi:alkanesulfonate monooxygenase SsuD/methylene tetrahydromethanopterin reductase-like flavin-dependent oxidoreductase (luciferase family)
MHTSLKFELRAPAFGAGIGELYAAALDMAEFADGMGISRINLQEHHGFDDNFMPTPFVMGGGIAARTKRCRINLGAVLLPLHDPVKIAEQIAVLDIMSGGRLEVIVGAGYVPWEFQAFNRSTRDRARLMDEGIEIILRALRGDRFRVGTREVFVRPLPIQKPEDIVFVGGGVEASARRAARFGLGFSPTTRGLFELYDSECRRQGREPGAKAGPSKYNDVHLSEDPDADWPKILPHLQHAITAYAKIVNAANVNAPFRGIAADEDALRKSPIFQIMTPCELLEYAGTIDEFGTVTFSPLMAGLAPEVGWRSLRLLAGLMPALQEIAPIQA